MNSLERCSAISPNLGYEALARDEEFLPAARSGSHAAFAELQRTYSHRIYQRILSITRNREDAEDALQDTFLRAYLALPSFEGRSKFSVWLTRIGINSALMVLRKRRGGEEVSIEQMRDDSENPRAWEPPDHSETPEAHCARREREELLRNAIQRLPCVFRDAVELRRSQEYSCRQIAEELGISSAAAKSRLMRARRTLGRHISGIRPRKSDATQSAAQSNA